MNSIGRRIVTVPTWVPLMFSVALSGLTAIRGASLIELGPGLPHAYQGGFETIGYGTWGWILVGVSVATLVTCFYRMAGKIFPLMAMHAVQACIYGVFTSLVLAYAQYPGATVAWISTLVYAGMHIVRIVSLTFESLTDTETPHGSY